MKQTSSTQKRSVILNQLYKWVSRIYTLLIGGFFGRLFTSYSAEESALENSRLFSGRRRSADGRLSVSVRLRIARAFENSFFVGRFESWMFSLLYYRLKTYGAFLLSVGAYGILSYIVKEFAVPGMGAEIGHLLICIAFLILSLPLLLSRETLASAILGSRFLPPILFEGLGVPRDTFTRNLRCPKRYGVVTAVGMLFGVLTYFVDPMYYVWALVVLPTAMVISQFPELGVIAWIAILPFVGFLKHPTLILAFLVAVTAVGYLSKLIRGKRVFRMHLIDYAIALLMLLYLMGGIISAGGLSSLASAGMYIILMMGYFLVVNLMRTREWVTRCIGTAVLSGTASCLVGVAQIFVGEQNASWLDVSRFSDIPTRIVGSFGNPNVFAEYLLLLIPFAVAFAFARGDIRRSVGYGLSLIVMIVCLVFTFSRGAWLGFLLGAVLFSLVSSKKSVIGLLGVGLALPLLSWGIPDAIMTRFLSIGDLAESSNSYRISAWKGVIQMLKETGFCGIGVGSEAFDSIYPRYAYAGIENLEHSHSLYLQLLVELGIPGLLVFAMIIFLFIQNGFEYLLKIKSAEGKRLVGAAMASLASLLVMAFTDHIWYHYGVFMAFWTMLAVVGAYMNIGRYEKERMAWHMENNEMASTLDIDMSQS